MTTPIHLVIGGTGTVGRHVVRQLVDAGQTVRVLARDSAKAAELGNKVEIVIGDLSKPETLRPAFNGAGKVFVLAPPVPDLVALEDAAFEAAKAAGVGQIVYLSNFGAGSVGPAGSIWQLHGVSESRLRDLGLAWAILRPARFMTDTPFPWAWDKERGLLCEPLGAGKVTMIAPQDVAAVAVKALLTSGHDGQVYELTSSAALGGAEIAEALGSVTGKPTKFVDIAPAAAHESMLSIGIPRFVADTIIDYYASVREGRWYVTPTAADLLGRAPLSFGEWLRDSVAAKG